MHKPLFFLAFIFSSFTSLLAQDYLGDDLPFFQKKARQYQSWLDHKGMGGALKVNQVRLQKNDMELELFLSLRTSDPDTAAGIWRSLDQAFTVGNPGQDMGEVLFDTFVRMMEIPAGQGNVQIYIPNRDGFGYNSCFYIWLWEEHGTVAQEARINNCRAQTLEIAVRSPQVKTVSETTRTPVRGKADARQVFDQIVEYARGHYETAKCEDRVPRVEEVELSDYQLSFTVSDLCREVLTEEQRSLWCTFVSRWMPCNDMRRERLEFTINYIPTEEGYLLSGQLTGKFGSGVYRPRKSAYMDMEPDFEEDFLKPYVKKFQNELRIYLEGGR